jgi:hypothetical protein
MMDASNLDLALLPEIDAAEVRLLWVHDWCDGPLEAIVEFRGNRCLLLIHDRGVLGTTEPWRWVLCRLTAAQLDDEERWWRLFLAHVGTQWDFTGEEHPEPSGQQERFYAEYAKRPEPALRDYEPVGWLKTMPTASRTPR